MTDCRTKPGGWISFRFLWLQCKSDQGHDPFYHLPLKLYGRLCLPPWSGSGLDLLTLTFWDICSSIFSLFLLVFAQMAELKLLLLLCV